MGDKATEMVGITCMLYEESKISAYIYIIARAQLRKNELVDIT